MYSEGAPTCTCLADCESLGATNGSIEPSAKALSYLRQTSAATGRAPTAAPVAADSASAVASNPCPFAWSCSCHCPCLLSLLCCCLCPVPLSLPPFLSLLLLLPLTLPQPLMPAPVSASSPAFLPTYSCPFSLFPLPACLVVSVSQECNKNNEAAAQQQ